MAAKRRRLRRPLGERRYRKLFVIAVEGELTEPSYFAMFSHGNSVIRVKCLSEKKKSAPSQVLRRMSTYLKDELLRPSDEAWVVVDKDSWSDDHLDLLFGWSQKEPNYHLALSNPKFEYWLLLHFEDGKGISSSRDCTARLARACPGYDKKIDPGKFTLPMIRKAVDRARQRDTPPCDPWPKKPMTTVYRLVEHILDVLDEQH